MTSLRKNIATENTVVFNPFTHHSVKFKIDEFCISQGFTMAIKGIILAQSRARISCKPREGGEGVSSFTLSTSIY